MYIYKYIFIFILRLRIPYMNFMKNFKRVLFNLNNWIMKYEVRLNNKKPKSLMPFGRWILIPETKLTKKSRKIRSGLIIEYKHN